MSSAAVSQTLHDLHLNIVQRTPEERERIASTTALTSDFTRAEKFEELPAGAATVRARQNADAFSQPSGNMTFDRELDFKVGNGLFRKIWVSAPSSTLASDGLGPLYNARGCQNCHIKDGRGHVPEGPEDNAVSIFLRISVPSDIEAAKHEIADYITTEPDPNYGSQLQDFATAGHAAEYRFEVSYEEQIIELSDGETASLRVPTYAARDLGYGPLAEGAMLSPRITPQMIGLGLIEAIPMEDILANVDETDANNDGISGRANIVWSNEFNQPMLGRFGLKAGMPTIREQSAAAFAGDIGISTPLFPAGYGDCTALQSSCRMAPDGGDTERDGHEVDQNGLDLVTFYARNLAVPARRAPDDAKVLRGKELFYATGCTSCHTPKFVTHRLEDRPEQSFQLIWPYSDFLLHDMGEGLADHRPEARATGSEWRTAPLWGIGLTEQVSGTANYLHDGRARTLLEAILWHGGEAETQQQRVIEMSSEDRDALISYLESL